MYDKKVYTFALDVAFISWDHIEHNLKVKDEIIIFISTCQYC